MTEQTHYVGYGISILDEKRIKEFFNQDSDIVEKLYDDYDDNAYQKEVTPTKSGLTLIVDGMNGKYIFFGKIIQKALFYEGLDFHIFEDLTESQKKEVIEESKRIFNFEVFKSDIKNIVFTHWH